ncbi:FxSxx-COOH system tetratricopeptide repeat protein, partial [Frankia sp. R82]|uniref:FxSxx-COOH system tetratricopeptide repeat protein n=1 Tax=Frankia sp. R82 TaxID=2950553 RepID=UPI0020445F1D
MSAGDQTAGPTPPPAAVAGGVDVFVSYTGADQGWAEWVAWQLEAAGYTTRLQAWDFGAGSHFVSEMHRAAQRAVRTVAVLSAAYLSSAYAEAEWQAAWARDPSGADRRLLVFRVEDCPRPGLLAQLVSVDLFGLDRDAAAGRLRAAARGQRGKPTVEPSFPGDPLATARLGVEPGFPGRLPVVWGSVPARNLLFTGRDPLLTALHDRLAGGGRVAVAGLQGMGGVGKTQLAVEYAWRYAAGLDLVWWVDAETTTGLETGLAELAGVLGVGEGDVPARARAALVALGRRQGWLLVYDNIPDPQTLAGLLPPGSGRLLVTSRDPGIRRVGVELVEVGEFTRPETAALLRRHVPALTDAEVRRVAEAVGDLPLAVEQAGAYLADTTMPVGVYLAALAATPTVLLDDDTLHHPGLTRTVTLAADRLAALHPQAARLLDQLAFLAPEPIPLTSTSHPDDGALVIGEPQTAYGMLAAIRRLALATTSSTSGTDPGTPTPTAGRPDSGAAAGRWRIHRLVQALLRARLTPTQTASAISGALDLLATAHPGDAENPGDWPAYATLTPHLSAAAGHLAQTGVAEPDGFRRLLERTGWYLLQAGQAGAARTLATPTRQRWTTHPGPDHPDTLGITTTLAAALADLGDPAGARVLAEDTLTRRRRILGDDHPDTLDSANNLALTLADLGDQVGARELAEDTLARLRRILGDDHPDTLTSANNLALTLADLGDQVGARELAEDT